jgi:hypothetical protein
MQTHTTATVQDFTSHYIRSHVEQYGDLEIGHMLVSDLQGCRERCGDKALKRHLSSQDELILIQMYMVQIVSAIGNKHEAFDGGHKADLLSKISYNWYWLRCLEFADMTSVIQQNSVT